MICTDLAKHISMHVISVLYHATDPGIADVNVESTSLRNILCCRVMKGGEDSVYDSVHY